jgi:hypothetical protein
MNMPVNFKRLHSSQKRANANRKIALFLNSEYQLVAIAVATRTVSTNVL